MWKSIDSATLGVLVAILVAAPAIAQTPWTDLSVTNGLAVQFDAGSGITLDANERVSEWNSIYWNGSTQYVASQSTESNRPQILTDHWNGRAAIRLNSTGDGSGGALPGTELLLSDYLPGFSVPTSGPASNYGQLSVFVVAKQSGLHTENYGSWVRCIVGSGSGDDRRALFFAEQRKNELTNAALRTHGREYVNFSGSENFQTSAAILGVVLDYHYDTSDPEGTYRLEFGAHYNGVLGQEGPWYDSASPRRTYVGIGGDPAGGRGFSGDIAEVIIFETALSGAERILVENHLSSKYAIPFGSAAAGHDYYSGETGLGGDTGLKFDAGVFGIGRMADGTSEVLVSTVATGVRFETASLAEGMWLLAGHNDAAHGWNTDSFYARWNREWAAEFTYNPGDTATFDLVFDFDAAGLTLDPDPEEPYGLMFKESYADPWQFAMTSYTVDGNSLVFSGIPMGDTGGFGFHTGYFTLGMVPEPSSVLLLCLALMGLLSRRRR